MSARAIWQGEITLEGMTLSVKLYSAVVDREVHFNLLHGRDGVRLQQRMVNPKTGKTIDSGTVRKASPVAEGLFVLLDKAEQEQLKPPSSRKMEITRFVPAEVVPLESYDRPYYLGPMPGGAAEYYALAAALARQGVAGIVRWVMRKKEYIGALRSEDGYLILVTLHDSNEVVSISKLDSAGGRALLSEEKKLAKTLIDSLTGKFQPSDFRDEYQERLRALVESKRKGKKIRMPRKPVRRPTAKTLADSLRQSLKVIGR